MKSNDKWIGLWVSAQLYRYMVWDYWVDDDATPKDTPDWILQREKEFYSRIKSYG